MQEVQESGTEKMTRIPADGLPSGVLPSDCFHMKAHLANCFETIMSIPTEIKCCYA